MREVERPPLAVLLALESDACERFEFRDGEVVRIGEWVVLRAWEEDGSVQPIVSQRFFFFANEDDAGETLGELLATEQRA